MDIGKNDIGNHGYYIIFSVWGFIYISNFISFFITVCRHCFKCSNCFMLMKSLVIFCQKCFQTIILYTRFGKDLHMFVNIYFNVCNKYAIHIYPFCLTILMKMMTFRVLMVIFLINVMIFWMKMMIVLPYYTYIYIQREAPHYTHTDCSWPI